MAAPPTVLVVEDVTLVRLLVADYLRSRNFRVIEASGADEAMIVLEADIAVDLVFADINMPGTKDGLGLAQWLHENRPDIKMVLGSGVAGAAEKAERLGYLGPIVDKPYDLPQLERRLRAALD